MSDDAMSARTIGRVAELWRYPVKAMAGEYLDAVDVSWHGLAGDRRWAFVRAGLERSGFPWLTIRERSDLWRFRPSFVDPTAPDRSATVVSTPDGERFDVTDPALATQLGHGVRVIKQDRGVFDASPLSLITTQTVESLAATVGRDLEIARFRPNVVIEAMADTPFAEDDWIGATLRVGGVRMRVDRRDGRCVVVNVDPQTAERDPKVLKTIVAERAGCAGVYATTVEPGRVAIGDPVTLL
jgi:uncharacterized protein YcbX